MGPTVIVFGHHFLLCSKFDGLTANFDKTQELLKVAELRTEESKNQMEMLRKQLHDKDKIINTLEEKIQNDKAANQNELQEEIEKLTSQLASVEIAKVIAAVLRFSDDQTDQIIKKQEAESSSTSR